MTPLPDDLANSPRHAADSARHAARVARRATFRASCDRTPWLFGTALIALGLLFLLDNLNLIEARFVFRNLWPLLLIFFGISRIMSGRDGERVVGVLATAFGGLWLADRLLDWDINIIGVFWPLILIGLGINLLFRSRRHMSVPNPPSPPAVPPLPGIPPGPPYAGFTGAASPADTAEEVDASASIREVAILAGIERRNVSQTFRGGTITAVMGSVELDLRDCRMADDNASIWIQAVMANITIRLPPNWTVESRLSTILGNLEDRSDRPVDASPRRLIIDGSVFMGQIEIRN